MLSSSAPARTWTGTAGRDVWWHDALDAASDRHTPEPMDAEHPLFILYTSGTTGKPKGILHTTGGYLTQAAYTHRNVFDLHPETDVYWCTADIGWVTGHSYIVYGPLANGATQVIYEGTPDTPHQGRWWEIVAEVRRHDPLHRADRDPHLHEVGRGHPGQVRPVLAARCSASVGEPINPEAWIWYRRVIGGDRTPIVDTWWQTETGAIMISPLPGVTDAEAGLGPGRRCPASAPTSSTTRRHPVPNGGGGYLVLTEPWPAMLRGIWGDPERYKETYWSRFEGMYFAGDGAKKDEDGDIWLLGRVDDVMNVSGHRLSTTEIESALVSHPKVAEAAVVGATDETTGQARRARSSSCAASADARATDIVTELRNHVAKEIGPIAKPRQILVVAELPKTRSGKIMRRLLRDVAENRDVGDVTTLADSTVMDLIRTGLSAGSAHEG